MADFSFLWFLLITIITWGVYGASGLFLKGRRKKLPLLALLCTVYVYSGVGIAYESVDKINALYYGIYITVLLAAYCVFMKVRFKPVIAKNVRIVEDPQIWSTKLTKQVFVGLMLFYLVLRLVSLVYPVNHLANFKFVYDSSNNIDNLTGKNTSFITTLARIIQPFFFVGMYYAVKRVRYVAAFLSVDALITLITVGYLSRYEIISICVICFFLYINGEIGNKPVTNRKKVIRIVLISTILIPVLAIVMVRLMNVRTAGGPTYTVWTMLESEIGYPKQYEQIHAMAPIVRTKDFFLHLLDSFIPIVPTPGYNMDLNVTFSEHMLGVKLLSDGFYIKLPGLLGEAFLIFGENWYWLHAIVIAFLTSLIYKMVGENNNLVILWYYYVFSILKVGRAGYIELSQGAWLNYLVFIAVLLILRILISSWRQASWQQEPKNQ